MIYLASPYSDSSDAVKYQRFLAVRDYVHSLMSSGLVVFSPIAYGRQFEKAYGLDGNYRSWERLDQALILASEAVWILKMPGWEMSMGVQAEKEFALANNIPITYVEYELDG